MRSREMEIEFLIRLYGSDDEMNMNHDPELRSSIKRTVTEIARAAERVGKDTGLWCFSCGASSVPLGKCGCEFGESFGCGSRMFCAACREARETVAGHIQKLLAAKKVDRVSSIRLRLLRELRGAARAIEGENSDAGDSRLLSFWLSNCDEFGDSAEAFRAGVVRAFKRTRFLDFAGLAKALRQQAHESLIRSIVRSGLSR